MQTSVISIAFPIREPLPNGAVLLSADVGGTKTDLAIYKIQMGCPPGIPEKMKDHDPAAVIGLAAKARCAICAESIRQFVRYLAIESSNFALKIKATGGVFLGGGILPKIWNENLRTVFLEHFFQVGRLKPLVGSIPGYLVMNSQTAMMGAAYFAR